MMICYICNKQVSKCLKVDNITFGYCEKHESIVQIGVVKFMLTHTLQYLHDAKYNEVVNKKSSAKIEFEKQVLPEDLNELDD
jgi:hypothetical protein